MTCLCWTPSSPSSVDCLGCIRQQFVCWASTPVVTHPLADALDLQTAAACSHGPVCHQGVGLVQANDVVPRVEAWVKVSEACGHNRVAGQGRTLLTSTWPLLLPPALTAGAAVDGHLVGVGIAILWGKQAGVGAGDRRSARSCCVLGQRQT